MILGAFAPSDPYLGLRVWGLGLDNFEKHNSGEKLSLGKLMTTLSFELKYFNSVNSNLVKAWALHVDCQDICKMG